MLRGFGAGSVVGFAAEVKPKAGLGFKASAAFPVSKPIAMLAFRAGLAPAEVQRLFSAHCYVNHQTAHSDGRGS